jgi:hypothetical protein
LSLFCQFLLDQLVLLLKIRAVTFHQCLITTVYKHGRRKRKCTHLNKASDYPESIKMELEKPSTAIQKKGRKGYFE